MTGYSCSECGASASIEDGALVRTCCHKAPVDALLTAHTFAVSDARAHRAPLGLVAQFFQKLLSPLGGKRVGP